MGNTGKTFEQEFIQSLPEHLYSYRIADPPQSFGGGNNLRFSNKNPFDFFIYDKLNLYALELKSSTTSSFSFPTVEETSHIINLKASSALCKQRKDLDGVNTSKESIRLSNKALASRNIKQHQIDGLLEAKQKGCLSYFIFNFSQNNNLTLAVDIDDFIEFRNKTDKKSMNAKDMISLCNTIVIENELKSKRKGSKKMLYHLEDLGIIYQKEKEVELV